MDYGILRRTEVNKDEVYQKTATDHLHRASGCHAYPDWDWDRSSVYGSIK